MYNNLQAFGKMSIEVKLFKQPIKLSQSEVVIRAGICCQLKAINPHCDHITNLDGGELIFYRLNMNMSIIMKIVQNLSNKCQI